VAVIDYQTVILDILDTAGTDQFSAMRDLQIKSCDGFLLVYSITSMASFNDLADLYDRICRVKDIDLDNAGTFRVPMVLVGTKADLAADRQVLTASGEDLAYKFGNCEFLEVSAKNRVNVEAVFEKAAARILASRPTDAKNKRKGNKSKKGKECALL
jgi:small GTP-binding protein